MKKVSKHTNKALGFLKQASYRGLALLLLMILVFSGEALALPQEQTSTNQTNEDSSLSADASGKAKTSSSKERDATNPKVRKKRSAEDGNVFNPDAKSNERQVFTGEKTLNIIESTDTLHFAGRHINFWAYQIFTGEIAQYTVRKDLIVEGDGNSVSFNYVLENIEWGPEVPGDALLDALKTNPSTKAAFAHCTNAADVAEVLEKQQADPRLVREFNSVAYPFIKGTTKYAFSLISPSSAGSEWETSSDPKWRRLRNIYVCKVSSPGYYLIGSEALPGSKEVLATLNNQELEGLTQAYTAIGFMNALSAPPYVISNFGSASLLTRLVDQMPSVPAEDLNEDPNNPINPADGALPRNSNYANCEIGQEVRVESTLKLPSNAIMYDGRGMKAVIEVKLSKGVSFARDYTNLSSIEDEWERRSFVTFNYDSIDSSAYRVEQTQDTLRIIFDNVFDYPAIKDSIGSFNTITEFRELQHKIFSGEIKVTYNVKLNNAAEFGIDYDNSPYKNMTRIDDYLGRNSVTTYAQVSANPNFGVQGEMVSLTPFGVYLATSGFNAVLNEAGKPNVLLQGGKFILSRLVEENKEWVQEPEDSGNWVEKVVSTTWEYAKLHQENNTYYFDSWVDETHKDEATTCITDTKGTVRVRGIRSNENFRLIQTEAPLSFELPSEDKNITNFGIYFGTNPAQPEDGVFFTDPTLGIRAIPLIAPIQAFDNGLVLLSVENERAVMLPNTGAEGVLGFVLFGALCMGVSALLYTRRKYLVAAYNKSLIAGAMEKYFIQARDNHSGQK